jgi:Tfp pilus assembly protein PilO
MKKEQQNLIIIAAGFIFLTLIYFKFLLIPINDKIKKTEQKIIEKSQELKRAKILAENLPYLKQETETLQIEIAELEKKLPKEANVPELLKIIGKEAQNYNIKISRLERQNIISSAKEFNEIPFFLSFKCRYHNLGQFLASIAQQKRIFASSNLKLRYEPSEENNLSGEIQVFAYTLK